MRSAATSVSGAGPAMRYAKRDLPVERRWALITSHASFIEEFPRGGDLAGDPNGARRTVRSTPIVPAWEDYRMTIGR